MSEMKPPLFNHYWNGFRKRSRTFKRSYHIEIDLSNTLHYTVRYNITYYAEYGLRMKESPCTSQVFGAPLIWWLAQESLIRLSVTHGLYTPRLKKTLKIRYHQAKIDKAKVCL